MATDASYVLVCAIDVVRHKGKKMLENLHPAVLCRHMQDRSTELTTQLRQLVFMARQYVAQLGG